jgi:hypothetical protein
VAHCRARLAGGDAVVGFLRQHHAGLRPLERRLARRDDLRMRAGIEIPKLRLGDDFGSQHLRVLCERFGVIDPTSTAPAGTFWPRMSAPSVDPRREGGRRHPRQQDR